MNSATSLLDEVRRCAICSEHLPLGARPVLQLHPQARILIAGQAPGRKAHHSGIPFADASGARLREWLRRNPWFEQDMLLRMRVAKVLEG